MSRPDRPVLRDYDPEKVAQLWAEMEPERDESGDVVEIPVFEMPTTYTVSVLPEEHDEAPFLTIEVRYAGGGRWRVHWASRTLDADGRWSFGRARQDDDYEDWLAARLFDLETALRLAREVAPELRQAGRTAREVAAQAAGKVE